MGDFSAQIQDFNLVTITTASMEAIGLELAPLGTVTSTAWPAANRAILVPFVVYAPFLAQKMNVDNGATLSGNIDVGIVDTGGNRLVSAGSTAQAGTSAIQTFDITDTTLQVGVYYMTAALDNATGQIRTFAPPVARASACGVLSMSTAFPIPATVTFAAAQDAVVPMISILGRTLV